MSLFVFVDCRNLLNLDLFWFSFELHFQSNSIRTLGPPGASSSCLSLNRGAPGLLAEFRTRGGTMLSGSLFPVEHPSTAARAVWRPEGGARGFELVGGGVCSLNLLCESDLWPLISREEQQTWRLWYYRCLMLINRSKTDCAAAVHCITQRLEVLHLLLFHFLALDLRTFIVSHVSYYSNLKQPSKCLLPKLYTHTHTHTHIYIICFLKYDFIKIYTVYNQ